MGNGRSMMPNRRSYPSVLANSRCPMDSACSCGRIPAEPDRRASRKTLERLESPGPGTVECIHPWGAFRNQRVPTRDKRVAGATRRYVWGAYGVGPETAGGKERGRNPVIG
ncbi:MAG: hypothetical protein ACYSWW_20920 [Planctomycetota bacterium]